MQWCRLFLTVSAIGFFPPAAGAADLKESVVIENAFVPAIGLTLQCVAFSSDGKTLVTAGTGGTRTCLWDPATGKHLGTLTEHPAATHGLGSLALSPDGKTLAGGHSRSAIDIQLWDVRTQRLTGTLKESGGV